MLHRAMTRFAIFTLFLLFSQLALADVSAGFADHIKIGGHQLVLNGAGTRIKLFVKAYNAALYLPQRSNNAEEILSKDTPIAIHMVITTDQSTTARMVNALKEGFQDSTQGNTAPIQGKIDKFISVLSEENVKLHDVLEFNYVPGKGVTYIMNGKSRVVIPGADFRQAFFGIWLSNNPVSPKLKNQLLGNQS
jgi:hypothetical protein